MFSFCGNHPNRKRLIESKNSKKKKRFESPVSHFAETGRAKGEREEGGGGTKLGVVFIERQKYPSHLGIDNMLLGAFKERKMGTMITRLL